MGIIKKAADTVEAADATATMPPAPPFPGEDTIHDTDMEFVDDDLEVLDEMDEEPPLPPGLTTEDGEAVIPPPPAPPTVQADPEETVQAQPVAAAPAGEGQPSLADAAEQVQRAAENGSRQQAVEEPSTPPLVQADDEPPAPAETQATEPHEGETLEFPQVTADDEVAVPAIAAEGVASDTELEAAAPAAAPAQGPLSALFASTEKPALEAEQQPEQPAVQAQPETEPLDAEQASAGEIQDQAVEDAPTPDQPDPAQSAEEPSSTEPAGPADEAQQDPADAADAPAGQDPAPAAPQAPAKPQAPDQPPAQPTANGRSSGKAVAPEGPMIAATPKPNRRSRADGVPVLLDDGSHGVSGIAAEHRLRAIQQSASLSVASSAADVKFLEGQIKQLETQLDAALETARDAERRAADARTRAERSNAELRIVRGELTEMTGRASEAEEDAKDAARLRGLTRRLEANVEEMSRRVSEEEGRTANAIARAQELHAAAAELQATVEGLQRKTEQLERERDDARSSGQELGEHAKRMVEAIETEAQQVRDEAAAEAKTLRTQAEAEATAVAQQILSQAEANAESIMQRARSQAEQVYADRQEAAADLKRLEHEEDERRGERISELQRQASFGAAEMRDAVQTLFEEVEAEHREKLAQLQTREGRLHAEIAALEAKRDEIAGEAGVPLAEPPEAVAGATANGAGPVLSVVPDPTNDAADAEAADAIEMQAPAPVTVADDQRPATGAPDGDPVDPEQAEIPVAEEAGEPTDVGVASEQDEEIDPDGQIEAALRAARDDADSSEPVDEAPVDDGVLTFEG